MRMARVHDEEDHPLSERGIEQRNQGLLRRYREFRRGAVAVTAAWRAHPEVIAVSLIGSVARVPLEGGAALRPVNVYSGVHSSIGQFSGKHVSARPANIQTLPQYGLSEG